MTVASPVSAELVETLRASGRIRHLRRGERLVHEGGRHGSVLLLISGTVRVLSYTVDGSEVLLAIRGPGELVGDFSPITGSAASATVEAREPTEVAGRPARSAFANWWSPRPRWRSSSSAGWWICSTRPSNV